MMNTCPKCNRDGIYWDGRAKVLYCPWDNCQYVVRDIPEWNKKIPTQKEIEKKLNIEDVDIENRINSRFEIMDL